jgi:hypothetical protein
MSNIPIRNISVPADAFNHGDNHTLCSLKVSWAYIAAIYIGNCATHAATVHTYPGEATQSIARAIPFALFFPTAGISRGLNAIFRHAIRKKNDLDAVARASALCFVVRSSKWRPPDWPEGRPFRVGEGNWIKEVPTFWPYFDTCLERPEPLRPTREPDETGTTREQGQTSGVVNNPSGAESCSASAAGAASFF